MFNWLDYLLIIFFVSGIIFGILRGYLWQIYRIGCLILAFVLSLLFHGMINNLVIKFLKFEDIDILGYAIIFFSTLFLTFIIGLFFVKQQDVSSGGSKMLGGLLGLVKNIIFCSIIINGLWILEGAVVKEQIVNTKIAGPIYNITSTIANKIPQIRRGE